MPGGSSGLLWLHRSLPSRLGGGCALVVGLSTHLGSCARRVFSGSTSSEGRRVSNRIAGTHQPGLVGQDDGLNAVAEVQLAEDARDVALDRRLAEEQALGELGVGKPLCEQLQDFELALCEQIEAMRGAFVTLLERGGYAVGAAPGDGRSQQ